MTKVSDTLHRMQMYLAPFFVLTQRFFCPVPYGSGKNGTEKGGTAYVFNYVL